MPGTGRLGLLRRPREVRSSRGESAGTSLASLASQAVRRELRDAQVCSSPADRNAARDPERKVPGIDVRCALRVPHHCFMQIRMPTLRKDTSRYA